MRRTFLVLLIVLTACTMATPAPTVTAPPPIATLAPTATPAPTVTPLPPTPLPPQLAVRDYASGAVNFVPVTSVLDPQTHFGGLLPRAAVVEREVFFLDYGNPPFIKAATTEGMRELSWSNEYPQTTLGRLSQELIWSVPPQNFTDGGTELRATTLDGASTRMVLRLTLSADVAPFEPLFARAANDGQDFFFSLGPYGIGGYILFGGASSLYRYNTASQTATELIPFGWNGKYLCLDDLSPDETRVAHHCDDDRDHFHVITLNGAQIAGSIDVYFPKELLGVAQIWGNARFSGDGARVAYALALGNPEAEQSWVAMSVNENLSGNTDSKVIATSEVGSYFTVLGWLNADTVLLQNYGKTPTVWSVSVVSGALTQLAEGEFLALVR